MQNKEITLIHTLLLMIFMHIIMGVNHAWADDPKKEQGKCSVTLSPSHSSKTAHLEPYKTASVCWTGYGACFNDESGLKRLNEDLKRIKSRVLIPYDPVPNDPDSFRTSRGTWDSMNNRWKLKALYDLTSSVLSESRYIQRKDNLPSRDWNIWSGGVGDKKTWHGPFCITYEESSNLYSYVEWATWLSEEYEGFSKALAKAGDAADKALDEYKLSKRRGKLQLIEDTKDKEFLKISAELESLNSQLKDLKSQEKNLKYEIQSMKEWLEQDSEPDISKERFEKWVVKVRIEPFTLELEGIRKKIADLSRLELVQKLDKLMGGEDRGLLEGEKVDAAKLKKELQSRENYLQAQVSAWEKRRTNPRKNRIKSWKRHADDKAKLEKYISSLVSIQKEIKRVSPLIKQKSPLYEKKNKEAMAARRETGLIPKHGGEEKKKRYLAAWASYNQTVKHIKQAIESRLPVENLKADQLSVTVVTVEKEKVNSKEVVAKEPIGKEEKPVTEKPKPGEKITPSSTEKSGEGCLTKIVTRGRAPIISPGCCPEKPSYEVSSIPIIDAGGFNKGEINIKLTVGEGASAASFGLDQIKRSGKKRVSHAYDINPASVIHLKYNFAEPGKYELVAVGNWLSRTGSRNTIDYEIIVQGCQEDEKKNDCSDITGKWRINWSSGDGGGDIHFKTNADGNILGLYDSEQNGHLFLNQQGEGFNGYWVENQSNKDCGKSKQGSTHWGLVKLSCSSDKNYFRYMGVL